jgi:cellulose synthase/poly-beta-1,6-N-acetylglucosamine synthase-like glycosyltransferase
MHTLIETLLLLTVLILLLPAAVLALELGGALLARAPQEPPQDHTSARPSVAVLIPAHNEEAGLVATLSSLQPQLGDGDRLVVIADNCTDLTAVVARRLGAEVCERTDPGRRGKGYALDFGIRFLALKAPQVVLIVDADCTADAGAIDTLARQAVLSGRPVQGRYLMHADADAALPMRIAQFAWLVKNYVRPMGLRHAGLPCQLMGSGMAFPWEIISKVEMANGNLVEDMQLGVDLAAIGLAPQFCPDAIVSSAFPQNAAGIAAQRARWEHGHLGVIVGSVPLYLWNALQRRDTPLAAMLIDLAVPPLALLVLFSTAAFTLSVLAVISMGIWMPFYLSVAQMSAIAAFLIIAWSQFSPHRLHPADLLGLLAYVGKKIPLYTRFLTARQKAWVRTERD